MTADLQAAYEQAEARAHRLQSDKDQAIQAIKDEYGPALEEANLEASEAQKAWVDAQAAAALTDRPDGTAVADSLGLTLPE